ncbi:hypothetical protein [Aliihoeflea sp. PC F10.4]
MALSNEAGKTQSWEKTPILLSLAGALVFTIGGIVGSIVFIPELRTPQIFSLPILAGIFVWHTFRLTVPVFLLLQWRAGRAHTTKSRSFKNLGRAIRVAFARRRFLAWYALAMTVVVITGVAFVMLEVAMVILTVLAAIVLLPVAFNLKRPWREVVILGVCAIAGIFFGPTASQSLRDFTCRGDAGLVTTAGERLPCETFALFADYDLIAVTYKDGTRLLRSGDVSDAALRQAIGLTD